MLGVQGYDTVCISCKSWLSISCILLKILNSKFNYLTTTVVDNKIYFNEVHYETIAPINQNLALFVGVNM